MKIYELGPRFFGKQAQSREQLTIPQPRIDHVSQTVTAARKIWFRNNSSDKKRQFYSDSAKELYKTLDDNLLRDPSYYSALNGWIHMGSLQLLREFLPQGINGAEYSAERTKFLEGPFHNTIVLYTHGVMENGVEFPHGNSSFRYISKSSQEEREYFGNLFQLWTGYPQWYTDVLYEQVGLPNRNRPKPLEWGKT